ncbi:hypothetical protein FQR65_LT01312 [Abscondita terminalis]|nr:hypothetical protein FQR65_LT01312 [Abscondita terminalis]
MSNCFIQCSLVFPERKHLVKDNSDEECLISDEQELTDTKEDEDYRIYRCIISWPRVRRGLGKLKRWTGNACTSKACRKCMCCTCVSLFTIIFLTMLMFFVALPLVFKTSIGLQRSLIFHPITQPSFVYNSIPISQDRTYYNCEEKYSNTKVNVNKKNHITLGVWNLTCSELYGRRNNNVTKPSLIIFHNEKGDRTTYAAGYRGLRKYFNVIAFDYRSYGDSSVADLNERGLVDDSVSLYKWLVKNSHADIFVLGDKLGASIATHVLSKLSNENIVPTGVILMNPFTSLSDYIKEWYWPLGKIMSWMPWYENMITEPLRRNDLAFNIREHIMKVNAPIMIVKEPYRFPLAREVGLIASNRDAATQGAVFLRETWWKLKYEYGADDSFYDYIDDCVNFKKNKGISHLVYGVYVVSLVCVLSLARMEDEFELIYKELEDHYNTEMMEKSMRKSWEDYWACEQSIASARASVMVYDDVNKKWVPSGSSSGLSKVHIYQHTVQQTFRVVGRKLHDHEVVINCAILKGLKYNQATPTFHQWRDNKHVYGLNFSSKEDADQFARAMFHSLEVLSNIVRQPQATTQYAPPITQQQQQQFDEDMGYRTMTREDVANIQERRISTSMMSPQQQTSPMIPQNNVPIAPVMPQTTAIAPSPVSPPSGVGGHQRTASAPPAPPPPPTASIPCAPPPVMGPDGGEVNSLAAQLQNARLKRNNKNTPPPTENSGSSTSSGGSSNYGTLGRGAGGSMASMMDEMAKTLARRRAAVEKKTADIEEDEKKATWEKTNTLPNNSSKYVESPKSIRKRFGSASEETILKVNGLSDSMTLGPTELESLKNEIVKEVKKEMAKMKQDIIDAIKSELNRR